jgi:hypothetical protein
MDIKLVNYIIASRTLIQLANILQKIYHFYTGIQKQICGAHVLTYHAVVLPATTSSTTHHPTSITV